MLGEDVGFEVVDVEIIEQQVWRGFIQFLEQHEDEMSEILSPKVWRPYKFIKGLLRFILDRNMLHYIIVSARKQ